MKKRDRQMRLWMNQKHQELENITDEEERLTYFENIVLPEMEKLEQKEQRTWDEHHADFDLDILERGFGSSDDIIVIPKMIVEACGLRKADIDDIVFSKKPVDIHHLVSDRNLCRLLEKCTEYQKELLFYIDIHNIDGAEIARAAGVNPRNINSVHARTIEHIRTQLLPLILLKFNLEHSHVWQNIASEQGIYTTYEERFFCATMGKDYLEYWENPYFEGVNFNLTPITEHHNAESKRK